MYSRPRENKIHCSAICKGHSELFSSLISNSNISSLFVHSFRTRPADGLSHNSNADGSHNSNVLTLCDCVCGAQEAVGGRKFPRSAARLLYRPKRILFFPQLDFSRLVCVLFVVSLYTGILTTTATPQANIQFLKRAAGTGVAEKL